jgi:glycosyltransferase involved in cell wall biosynthesis
VHSTSTARLVSPAPASSTNSMRILHLDEQREWRGGEQQASYLMKGLAARGHNVFMAGRSDTPFLTRDHGFRPEKIFPAPFLFELDLWTASQLAGIVDRYKIDIVHAHTSHAHGIACVLRTLTSRPKIIVSRRVDFPPKTGLFSRIKYGRADHYIAISNCIGKVLTDYGISEKKVTVVHSGIDLARLDVEPIRREDLGIPEGVLLIGNVAALVGHKDHETLVRAMTQVVKRIPDARLIIAGEGPLRPNLEQQIATLGLNRNITLLGYRKDIPNILRALDLFVMSSKEEGLGTSVLDAMACDIPVVATAAGGIPEMIQDNQTGLLAPVGDAEALANAIIRPYSDEKLKSHLQTNAQKLVHSQFTAERMVEGNIRVYERVLKL